eukprot:scaffold104804_cov57-Attheya_sp.AAC.3
MDSPGEIVEDEFTLVEVPDISVGQPKEFASSLGVSWPIMQRNQNQMAARVEKVHVSSVKLAKDLSNELDTFDVRFDQVQRILGEWPDEFATSNLCEVATDLIEDVDKIGGRVEALERKPTLNPKQIEDEAARKLAEWMSTELKPLYLLYAKLSTALETPGDRFESISSRVDALESGRAQVPASQSSGHGTSGIAVMYANSAGQSGSAPMDTGVVPATDEKN